MNLYPIAAQVSASSAPNEKKAPKNNPAPANSIGIDDYVSTANAFAKIVGPNGSISFTGSGSKWKKVQISGAALSEMVLHYKQITAKITQEREIQKNLPEEMKSIWKDMQDLMGVTLDPQLLKKLKAESDAFTRWAEAKLKKGKLSVDEEKTYKKRIKYAFLHTQYVATVDRLLKSQRDLYTLRRERNETRKALFALAGITGNVSLHYGPQATEKQTVAKK